MQFFKEDEMLISKHTEFAPLSLPWHTYINVWMKKKLHDLPFISPREIGLLAKERRENVTCGSFADLATVPWICFPNSKEQFFLRNPASKKLGADEEH